MTVQELIDALQKIENKELDVCIGCGEDSTFRFEISITNYTVFIEG